jgi:hypothetical protein
MLNWESISVVATEWLPAECHRLCSEYVRLPTKVTEDVQETNGKVTESRYTVFSCRES